MYGVCLDLRHNIQCIHGEFGVDPNHAQVMTGQKQRPKQRSVCFFHMYGSTNGHLMPCSRVLVS